MQTNNLQIRENVAIRFSGAVSKLSRIFCISLKQIIVVLLLVIVVTAGVFWAIQRINTHKVWASMLRESQRFMIHLDEVYVLLPAKFQGESIPTHYYWFLAELSYAQESLYELTRLDGAHQSKLFMIDMMIDALRNPSTNGVQLNDTQFWDLSNTIHHLGQKVAGAYWSLTNYTSVNGVNGPPFWYFGPSPPDETVLQEAVDLAVHAKAIIGS
jgi:hypothetical protein